MRILPGSKTPKILELHEQGMPPAEIASVVQVDRTYIYRLLHRHGRVPSPRERLLVSRPAPEDISWLQEEARRTGTDVADLARALLTDAIYEARNGKD